MRALVAIQRVTLAIWGVLAGALALAGILLPQWAAHQVYGKALTSAAMMFAERADGARLGLAVLALIAALTPKPPRALVWTMIIALAASAIGPSLARLLGYVTPVDAAPFWKGLAFDGAAALTLLVTQELRAWRVRQNAA
jgi:hypothetical protein